MKEDKNPEHTHSQQPKPSEISEDELSAVAGGEAGEKGKCLLWENFKKMRPSGMVSPLDEANPGGMQHAEIVGFSGSFG